MPRTGQTICVAVILAALLGVDARSQNPVPSDQAPRPAAAEQRGTDQVPLTVKVLPPPDAQEQADKAEHDRREKAIIDEKLAFETQRIADYTDRLALFTLSACAGATTETPIASF